jgi:hypothetical protein
MEIDASPVGRPQMVASMAHTPANPSPLSKAMPPGRPQEDDYDMDE